MEAAGRPGGRRRRATAAGRTVAAAAAGETDGHPQLGGRRVRAVRQRGRAAAGGRALGRRRRRVRQRHAADRPGRRIRGCRAPRVPIVLLPAVRAAHDLHGLRPPVRRRRRAAAPRVAGQRVTTTGLTTDAGGVATVPVGDGDPMTTVVETSTTDPPSLLSRLP